jgi:DNA-binding SARP family transcriptional activator
LTGPPHATTAPVRVCPVGPRQRLGADGTLQVLERKDAALLALLAFAGPTRRARAAALLWPDASEARARANLRQRQRRCRLRRAAPPDVVRAGTPRQRAATASAKDGTPPA